MLETEKDMKLFRNLGKYPFMMLLSTSTLILTVMAYMGKNSVYADYSVELIKHPRLAVVFEGLKDKKYPWDEFIDNKAKNSTLEESPIEGSGTILENNTEIIGNDKEISGESEAVNIAQSSGTGTDSTGNNSQGVEVIIDKQTKENDENKTGDEIQSTDKDIPGNNSGSNSQSGEKDTGGSKDIIEDDAGDTGKTKGDKETDKAGEAEQSSIEFAAVKESYFDDALFIGDSRTVGLADYSGWKNPTFYADVGLTIYDIFDKKIAEVNGKKTTIAQALQEKSFKKIYIMLGINEMGTGNAESFTKAYQGVIEQIEELQPNAIIFVEAIMNVTKEKSDTDPIFNNTNIIDRNNHLATLADNKKIFYIDVNKVITDSTGGIPAEYTFDNIHLKAAYYKLWTDFLLEHGVLDK